MAGAAGARRKPAMAECRPLECRVGRSIGRCVARDAIRSGRHMSRAFAYRVLRYKSARMAGRAGHSRGGRRTVPGRNRVKRHTQECWRRASTRMAGIASCAGRERYMLRSIDRGDACISAGVTSGTCRGGA